MVWEDASDVRRTAIDPAQKTRPSGSATEPTEGASVDQQTTFDGLSFIRKQLYSAGLSKDATTIILSAWRGSTLQQYRSYWARWFTFCHKRKISPLQVSVQVLITFLSQLFHQGLSYSAVNSARSAVVTLVSTCTDTSELGSSVLLQKFMKGVFASRPAVPKTYFTWDVALVLKFLKSLSPPKALNLLALSRKLATLLALLSGQRGQSLHLLRVEDCECTDTQLVLRFSVPLKQTRLGKHVKETCIPAYPEVGFVQ